MNSRRHNVLRLTDSPSKATTNPHLLLGPDPASAESYRQRLLPPPQFDNDSQTDDQSEREEVESPLVPHLYEDTVLIDSEATGYTYICNFTAKNSSSVTISVRSPHFFCLQTIEDLRLCDVLFSQINFFYNKNIDSHRLAVHPHDLRMNFCCMARDLVSPDVWNRAQVLSYDAARDECGVLLVDLGTWDCAYPRKLLRHILVPFREEPVRSVPCRLSAVAPARPDRKTGLWSEYATKTFHGVIGGVRGDVEIIDRHPNGQYFINLFAYQDLLICVNDFLISQKIAIPADDVKTLTAKQLDENGQPLMASVFEFIQDMEALANERKEQEEAAEAAKLTVDFQTIPTGKPCIRVFLLESPSMKRLVFVRHQKNVWVPWFALSALFQPPLRETEIELFTTENHFNAIRVSALTEPVLASSLHKAMVSFERNTHRLYEPHRSSSVLLLSLDCVRRLLQERKFDDRQVWQTLDLARQPSTLTDEHFWEPVVGQNELVPLLDKENERREVKEAPSEDKGKQLRARKRELEEMMAGMRLTDPGYDSIQFELRETLKHLRSHDSSYAQ